MAEKKINWTLNVNIPGGPSISASSPLIIEAYDMIEVEIKKGTTRVQTGSGDKSLVNLVLIKTDVSDGSLLTYHFIDDPDHPPTPAPHEYILDTPLHLFMGKGCVGVLESVKNIIFTNDLTNPVNVQILVGRDATPA